MEAFVNIDEGLVCGRYLFPAFGKRQSAEGVFPGNNINGISDNLFIKEEVERGIIIGRFFTGDLKRSIGEM